MSDTTPEVATAATFTNAIALDQRELIGLYEVEGAPRALLRHPSGAIEVVEVGQAVDGETILAITIDGIDLGKAGTRRRLAARAA